MRSLIRGFTLLELLIVILMVGILFSVVIANIRGELISNQIRAAASQIAPALENLRSSAVKTSKDAKFTLINSGKSYEIRSNGTGVGDPVQTIAIPDGVQLTINSANSGSVTYTAPYGDIDASGRTLIMTKTGGTSQTIYLVGVTGKVVR